MWLYDSSVGRKVVMSVSGIALILFLTFHASMNVVALFSGDAYNAVCEFLGANWYAVAGTLALAFLVCVHFVYAFILTLQNRKARGTDRYAVTARPDKVEWASQNMFVLGLIVVLGLVLHLYNFWANMMLTELLGTENACGIDPTDGYEFMVYTFGCPVYAVIYIIWLVALWFHLTHGFWSAMQTLGWNDKICFNRYKLKDNDFLTIVILAFMAVVLRFALCGGAC